VLFITEDVVIITIMIDSARHAKYVII